MSKITFEIGSTFNGAGFAAANKEIKNAGSSADKMREVISRAGVKLTECEGMFGKVASGAMSVANGFKTMGVAGGAAALVVESINLVGQTFVDRANEMAERARKAGAALKESYNEQVAEMIGAVTDAIGRTRGEVGGAQKDFESLAASATKVQSAMNATLSASGRAEVQNLQIEKLNAVIAEQSEAGKKVVAAQYDVAIAEQQLANVEAEGAAQKSDAQRLSMDAETRVQLANDKVAAAADALAAARETAVSLENANAADKANAEKLLQQAESDLADAKREQQAAISGMTAASENLKTVELNVSTARAAEEAKLIEAQAALETVNAAEIAAAEARQKEADAAAKAAAQAEQTAAQAAALNSAKSELVSQRESTAAAYASAMSEIENLINIGNAANERSKAGMAADAANSGFAGGYDYHTDANGNITDFEDYQRAKRFSGRADRDQETQDRHNAYLQDQYDKLKEKERKGSYLSAQDRKNMSDWEEFVAGKDVDDNSDRLATLNEEMNNSLASIDESIQKITDKLEGLGLK